MQAKRSTIYRPSCATGSATGSAVKDIQALDRRATPATPPLSFGLAMIPTGLIFPPLKPHQGFGTARL
jgi:hypothetical protein